MSTNRFWHRGISVACLGVFSLFLMTATTGCSNCCMDKGDGSNQAQAGFDKCGSDCTKSCCKKTDAKAQTQGGFDKCGAKCDGSGCKGKSTSGCSGKAKTTQTQAGLASGSSSCRGSKAKTAGGTTASSLNTKCPISGRPISAASTVSYGDKTVGFCCGGCISKWNAMTDADKTSKLAGA